MFRLYCMYSIPIWCPRKMFTPRRPWFFFLSKRAATSENVLQTCAPSEDSDQTEHSCSLIRIFTGRILNRHGYKVSISGQWKLWADCALAHADLSLRWEHMSEGTFPRIAVQMIVCRSLSTSRLPFWRYDYVKVLGQNDTRQLNTFD